MRLALRLVLRERGAKMEILAAGWLDLAPPFVLAPGRTTCVTQRGV